MKMLTVRQIVALWFFSKFARYCYKWTTGYFQDREPLFDFAPISGDVKTLFNEDGSFRLCNRTDMEFLLQPVQECAKNQIVMIVMSSPSAAEFRTKFRLDHAGRSILRILFIVGETNEPILQKDLELEASEHDDILQINSQEGYRSVAVKALSGFVWVSQRCNAARYVVKTDLNTKINLDFVLRALDRPVSKRRDPLRVECPHPLRFHEVIRPTPNPKSITGKWALSKQQMRHDVLPSFCSGWFYALSPQSALALAEASVSVPWDDAFKLSGIADIFITGVLRQSVENMGVHSMLNWWQRRFYEGFVIKCPFMLFNAVTLFNPVVTSKVSADGVSYVNSPSYYCCIMIEVVLQRLDTIASYVTKQEYMSLGLWDVCSRDNLDMYRVLKLFVSLLAAFVVLLVLVSNVAATFLSWLRRFELLAWNKQRTD